MNQRTYEQLGLGATQKAIFYRELKEAKGAWVPSKTLGKRAGSVWPSCVVRDLRELGIPVQHNRRCTDQSAYRLEVLP